MNSIFLSPDQIFDNPLYIFKKVGTAAPATDFVRMLSEDDGFLFDESGSVNYFLEGGDGVDRFGRKEKCLKYAVRPVLVLDNSDDEKKLKYIKDDGKVTTAEFGTFPQRVLDSSLRESAAKAYSQGTLVKTGRTINISGTSLPIYRFGSKKIVAVKTDFIGANGFIRLSDGSIAGTGETIFIEFLPIRWLYDSSKKMLISAMALISGIKYDEAVSYMSDCFINDITYEEYEEKAEPADKIPFRISNPNELDLIRAYIEADIPVFIHGLSGDGKSDRVREIDPQVLDIELVNENPETINGRAIYNESKDEIIDIKPVWLVKLERLCEDGKIHILFFDELTNATKQTQSVIFKIILDRFVNNRWPLPTNVRIVAAGNDRSESSAAHDLAEPLFGRFAHVYIRTTIENWMPWALNKKINTYVLEFLANNELFLRTPYTGSEGYADPRRWEMVSKALNSSGNDFSLLAPIVGREASENFIRFFSVKEQMSALENYTDDEISHLNAARRYQIAQQCLYFSSSKPDEALNLVSRLGPEYLAWFEYVLKRKAK